MKRKTKVRIQRALILAKIAGGSIGLIILLCRFSTLRHLVGLFVVSCVMAALWEYAEWQTRREVERDETNPV